MNEFHHGNHFVVLKCSDLRDHANVADLIALGRIVDAMPATSTHWGGIVSDVMAELESAADKFPTWPTDPLHAVAVLSEEAGELVRAVLQAVYEPHKAGPREVRKEAIQTAAMALRFIHSEGRYDYTPAAQHPQFGTDLGAACRWGQQDQDGDCFDTSCGHTYIVNDGETGGMTFCTFCGKRAEFVPWTDESDEAAALEGGA